MASAITSQTRTMRANDNLVLQVIKSQAGTLSKAILEGVMNSIDQEAENITVSINATTVTIKDDGRGFSGQDVQAVFEEFGKPHPLDEEGFAKDTTFGKFRIGRGQMFAFGKNTWRSANYRMLTDVDNRGLDYTFEDGHEFQPGCVVEIELYEALSLREIQAAADSLTHYCRYTKSNLTVNGVSIANDPAKLKWDVVNEIAYIKKKAVEHRWSSGSGLDIYQQGVFVENIPTSTFGLEGVVVIRQEVSVNFARNQVLRRCPRWKRIEKMLKEEGINAITKKARLTRAEARNFVEEFSGGGGEVSYEAFFETACLPDVTGKMWSPMQFKRLINASAGSSRVMRNADGCILIGFAPKGDREAEKVMLMKKAVVLDEVVLEQLRVDHIKGDKKCGDAALRAICGTDMARVANPLSQDRFNGRLIWCDFKTLLNDESDSADYYRFSADEFTSKEHDFLRCVDTIMRGLDMTINGWQQRQNRASGIGSSRLCGAWTDGATHITFDREFVGNLALEMERDWFRVGLLCAKLYSYNEDSTRSSDVEEGVEFLQSYLRLTEALPDISRQAYQTFITLMNRRVGKLTKSAQNSIHKEAETHATLLMAYQPENQVKPTRN